MDHINHEIKCLNPVCIGGRIETTIESDSGYSNWTVLDSGFIEFKCHGCGKFGSTDPYKDKENNQLNNFEVRCNVCYSKEWDSEIGDVDGESDKSHIQCKNCGHRTYEIPQKEE